MKKILNGHTVWRANCPFCDCEFEYNHLEIFKSKLVRESNEIHSIVKCPSCKGYVDHGASSYTTTRMEKEDTMTT